MSHLRERIIILVAAWAVGAPWCLGQIPSQHPRIKPVPREPEYPDKSAVPEDARQNILLPTEPPEFGDPPEERSSGVIGRVQPELRRLPDGYVVANRTAHISREGADYVARLEPVAGLPDTHPMRILPNGQMTLLETVLADTTRTPDFLITGRVTEFHATNYLLLESIREGAAPRPATDLPTLKPAPADSPGAPAATPPTTGPSREPTAEEVVRQLMQNRPRRSLVITSQPATASQPAIEPGATPGKEGRWSEDTALMDRPGRLVPGETWWTFAFEDLSQVSQQKPVRLLPNQLLETAINLSGGGAKSAVLIISGDITVHKGTEYLLLRKVLVRRDLGNFR